jgi:hypothetical protein
MSAEDASVCIHRESEIYAKLLESLQGVVVPKVFGIFGGVVHKEAVWAMVMEDVGEGMTERMVANMSVVDK